MENNQNTSANKPATRNAGGFRRLTLTNLANDIQKEKKHQVNPALAAAGGALCGIIFFKKFALSTNFWYFCKKQLL